MSPRVALASGIVLGIALVVFPTLARSSPGAAPMGAPVGTAFLYQGQLKQNGQLVTGQCDLQFQLFNDPTAGTQVGPTQTFTAVSVTGGVATVTLDFGASAFTGNAGWLQLATACPSGSSLTPLTPRQALAPTPNAVFAETAQSASSATTATNFSGSLAGDVTGTQGATSVVGLRGVAVASTAPTDGQVLQYSQSQNQWAPGTLAFGPRGVQEFTTSGPFTVPAGVTGLLVEAWGAGGGGGGGQHCGPGCDRGGGGGGAGAYAQTLVSVTPGASLTVTIGFRGLGGPAGTPGATGGSTLISPTSGPALITVNGGAGGGGASPDAGGSAGGGGAASAGSGVQRAGQRGTAGSLAGFGGLGGKGTVGSLSPPGLIGAGSGGNGGSADAPAASWGDDGFLLLRW